MRVVTFDCTVDNALGGLRHAAVPRRGSEHGEVVNVHGGITFRDGVLQKRIITHDIQARLVCNA